MAEELPETILKYSRLKFQSCRVSACNDSKNGKMQLHCEKKTRNFPLATISNSSQLKCKNFDRKKKLVEFIFEKSISYIFFTLTSNTFFLSNRIRFWLQLKYSTLFSCSSKESKFTVEITLVRSRVRCQRPCTFGFRCAQSKKKMNKNPISI